MRENRIGMGIWQLEQHLFIASTFIFPLKWLCSLDLAFYFWLICYFYERRFMDKLFTWLISFIWLRIFCSFHKKSKILRLLNFFFLLLLNCLFCLTVTNNNRLSHFQLIWISKTSGNSCLSDHSHTSVTRNRLVQNGVHE